MRERVEPSAVLGALPSLRACRHFPSMWNANQWRRNNGAMLLSRRNRLPYFVAVIAFRISSPSIFRRLPREDEKGAGQEIERKVTSAAAAVAEQAEQGQRPHVE